MNVQYQNFLKTLELFTQEKRKLGIMVKPYSEASLKVFNEIPVEIKNKVMHRTIFSLKVIEEYNLFGFFMKGNKPNEIKALYHVYKTLSMSDIERILEIYLAEEPMSVEVYDQSGMTLFRNWKSIMNSGYDILSLFIFNYFELYQLRPHIEHQLKAKVKSSKKVGSIVGGPGLFMTKPIMSNIHEHLLTDVKVVGNVKSEIEDAEDLIIMVSKVFRFGQYIKQQPTKSFTPFLVS